MARKKAPPKAAPAPEKRDPAAHLVAHRFQPGQSGNPAGRPKGRSITALLRELLDLALEGDPEEGPTALEKIGAVILKEAARGDLAFINLILDRTEGGAKQSLDVTSKGEALGQVVIYLPDNGRDGGTGATAEDRPAAGPADGLPG